jgi:uncharacterized repeat protein (TIGR02543 family)
LPNVLLDDSDGAGQQRIANNKLARIKVVNAAFQSGNVNALLNGNAVVSNLAYAAASTYNIIQAGAGTVTFEATTAPGAPIASMTNTFLGATDQTIYVTGFAGATTAVALRDDNLPPGPSSAAVRFVNASPDSGPLDAYINDVRLAQGIPTNGASQYFQIVFNTYTVTFDPDNGEETFTATVEHGGTIAAPEQPTNGGKVFEGWFADGAAEAFDFDTPITGNMTLTAHWSEQLEMIGTRISFEDGAVLYNNGTPYMVWNGGEMTPAIRVEAENDDVLTSSDYTITYLRNAEPGTGYIRVTVTKTGYNSPADAWFKIYLPASESLTVENIKAGIKLTWTPVEGAAGYVIYRRAWSTTTNGWTAFDRWYNTTETTWTDGSDASHKVYAGTRYQYGVKAYFAEKTDDVSGATIGGAMDNYNLGVVSSLKTTVRITTRTLNSVISSDGKLAVKWSGSKVFTGYQVQIATDENFTTIVKDEKIASATTYSKVYEGLTVGTTYYVRIRSYHVFNGMTYYGEWSNVRNAMLQ